jgi:histidyl-tRNA synthetase
MSKNKLSTEPYKGVRDFYPEDQALLNYIIKTWRDTTERFGYVEYGASILESAELYRSKGADNEEIIRDQSYTFTDRGEREVTLRPEMTPTVARMVAGKRRELGYPLRWYSVPNCFRYERPQRGRLREFWQLNADIFGTRSPAADAEIISLAYEIVRAFGGKPEDFEIRLGSRAYMESVAAELELDDATKNKMLELLDRRNKMPEAEFVKALDELGVPHGRVLGGDTPQDVADVLAVLESLGVPNAKYDPSVVRGFAYYTGVVFEVFDTHPDNNRALFGGGRYDNLTQLFDDEPLPGIGFGMGDVTIRDFLDVRGLLPAYMPATKVYIAVAAPEVATVALQLAGELRGQGVAVAVDFGERKLGDQIKVATKHRVPWLIVVGDNEISSGTFGVKNLDTGATEQKTRAELASFFLNL